MHSLEQRLRSQHESLNALFEDIADRAHRGDSVTLDGGWSELEATLVKHMDFEERLLLGRVDDAECARIRAEHDTIRRTLTELGISIELHTLREDTVREFLVLLRAHAAREALSLYPHVDAPSPINTIAAG